MSFSPDQRHWQMLGYIQSHAHYELVLWGPLGTYEVTVGRLSWQVFASAAKGGESILCHSLMSNTSISTLKTCFLLIVSVSTEAKLVVERRKVNFVFITKLELSKMSRR